MKILAVETATDACSAALWLDGQLQEKFTVTPRAHTQLILPMIEALMAEAQLKPQQLDALALGRGPGSFTGLRIAAGVVQGIAIGADLPVVPVSTLAALAQDLFNQQADAHHAFTAMDARMSEIFWAVYSKNAEGIAELSGIEVVTPAADIVFPDRCGYGIGSAWQVYADTLQHCLGERLLTVKEIIYPHAAQIAQLGAYGFAHGQAVAVELAMPVYLRDKVAMTQAERGVQKS